jgi:putative hydrolase of the HAD superfamily
MTSGLPKAMLVDLDDTILAYEPGSVDVLRAVCAAHVDRLPNWTVEQLVAGIDSYRRWFWSDPARHQRARLSTSNIRHEIMVGAFRQMGVESLDIARSMGDAYGHERERRVLPFPGAVETLATLQEAGVRMALITNGSSASQRGKIDRFDLERFFDLIMIEEEFGVGKPDERVYLHALDQLDARPDETWMIGDNLAWEVAAPQRLGITGIWHDFRGRGLPDGSSVRPDRIVRSLRDVLQVGFDV